LPELAHPEQTLAGFQQVNMSVFEQGVRRAQSEWSARLGEQLDRRHLFLTRAGLRAPSSQDSGVYP
jgi:hypothetical protein